MGFNSVGSERLPDASGFRIGLRAGVVCVVFIMLALFSLPAHPQSGYPDVSGTWYMQGRPNLPAYVQISGGALVFINEKGDRSRGHFIAANIVVADDWGGLRGNVDQYNSVINWANGSVWQRSSTPTINVSGTWYREGRQNLPAYVQMSNGMPIFINEKGERSRGHFAAVNVVIADDWGGLRGTVDASGSQISWANGSTWTRAGVVSPGYPNIAGTWYREASQRFPAFVEGSGSSLVFINEKGERSAGYFQSGNTVIAQAWQGGLRGTLDASNTTITWANGSRWTRNYVMVDTPPTPNPPTPPPPVPNPPAPPPPPVPNPPPPTPAGCSGSGNLALGKATAESSLYNTNPNDSRLAIDGNAGTFTSTGQENNPWWEIDLGAVCRLAQARIFNRGDCCRERLRTFRMLVSSDHANWSQFYVHNGSVFGDNQQPLILPMNTQARWVRIQLSENNILSIAELELYGGN
jgi:hypothetical protein